MPEGNGHWLCSAKEKYLAILPLGIDRHDHTLVTRAECLELPAILNNDLAA
jgi:hypothetical protein